MPKNVKVEVEKQDEEKEDPAQFYVAVPVYLLKPSQVEEMERAAEDNRGKGDPVSLPTPDHYLFQLHGRSGDDKPEETQDTEANQ